MVLLFTGIATSELGIACKIMNDDVTVEFEQTPLDTGRPIANIVVLFTCHVHKEDKLANYSECLFNSDTVRRFLLSLRFCIESPAPPPPLLLAILGHRPNISHLQNHITT